MIIPMARIRILGPRDRLEDVLLALQDEGSVHLIAARPTGPFRPVEPTDRELRHARHFRALLHELEGVIPASASAETARAGEPPAFPVWARQSNRLRRQLDRLEARRCDLEEERTRVARMEQFIRAFRGMLPAANGSRMQSYQLVLRGEDVTAVSRLREALAGAIGDQFVLEATALPSGELAAVLLVPRSDAPRVDRLLAQAGVHEMDVPPEYTGRPLGDILPDLAARRAALEAELAALARERSRAEGEAAALAPAQAALRDRLSLQAAREQAAVTPRSFLVEGWVPEAGLPRLRSNLAGRFGDAIVVEAVDRAEWQGEDAPVVLHNPRLFRPFELLTRMLPLPRYGTIDPTPFVGVFFPMFFGLILGDIGYGLVLATLALWLRHKGKPGSLLRAVGEVLGAAAAFTVAFGMAFGELFGDLGRRVLGLRPLLLDREHALLPFLGLAVAIGVVHIVIGLFLGVINRARGHPRHALGRGVALVMVLLIVAALLAAFDVLPGAFFTPVVVTLLVVFPVLVVLEGIIAPIEFLGTLSNILSYARIMALGTASVMMAVVANQLAGTFGSVIVGLLFALLFHLVNFVLGVFAPTIHSLRLHYVEFFGKFYSPGGQVYQPFGRSRPTGGRAA
jgi:V/A-type H+-transporting ATPase subunit I